MRKLLMITAMLLMTGCAGWTVVDTTPHPVTVGYYWVSPMERAFGDYYYYYRPCTYSPYVWGGYNCDRYYFDIYHTHRREWQPRVNAPERARPRNEVKNESGKNPPKAAERPKETKAEQPKRARTRPPVDQSIRDYRMRVEIKPSGGYTETMDVPIQSTVPACKPKNYCG